MNLRQKKKLEKKGELEKVPGKKLRKYARKNLAVVLGLIALCILSVMGASFAVLSLVIQGEEEVGLTLGTFDITLHDGEVINLENTYPMSDEDGLKQNSYSFSIENTGSVTSAYRIVLETDSTLDQGSVIPLHYMKIAIKENDGAYSTPALLSDIGNGLYIINNKTLDSLDEVNYEIKLWLDESAGNDMMNRVYSARLKVEAVQLIDGKYLDTTAPVITLSGDYVINTTAGANALDVSMFLPLSIYDDTDTMDFDDITLNFKECDINGLCTDIVGIDADTPGMYQIYYEATDSSLNTGIAVRNINIHKKDTVGPVITLTGEETIIHDLNSEYIESGYTASDDVDGNITGNVVVVGSPNVNLEGTYVVKYIVGDTSGNYSMVSRTITVKGHAEDPSGANSPELIGDMIPVIYDEVQEEWVKANPVYREWYDYDEQWWANAVTVTSTNRETLVKAPIGAVIPTSDINGMFVWIPRYSYTIGNTYGYQGYGGSTSSAEAPGAFDVNFIKTDVVDLGTAKYTGDVIDNWYTNPAFCWGDTCDDPATRSDAGNRELSGIWVGKFESGTTGGVTTNAVQQPIIKPNINSWRGATVVNAFFSVEDYMAGINGETIFGLYEDSYVPHIVKNTEWGAITYLSQSKYGKYGNVGYVGVDKEIYRNNCNTYITGIGADAVDSGESSVSCSVNTYETILGQAASSTGNIYGIYDMAGGTYEFVMGFMKSSSGEFLIYPNGFITDPGNRYYNHYEFSGVSPFDFSRRILGDASEEILGFYGDLNYFPFGSYHWVIRGGNYAEDGVFYINMHSGQSVDNATFRVALIK